MPLLSSRWAPHRRRRGWGASLELPSTTVKSIIVDPSDSTMLLIQFGDGSTLPASPIYLRNEVAAEELFEDHDLNVQINMADVVAMLSGIGLDASEWPDNDEQSGRWWG